MALTRRAGAQLAGLRQKRDPTLVRHIYDLHMLGTHVDQADVASLSREVMVGDAETRGDKFLAYRDDPLGETLKAVKGIAADPEFATEYETFVRRTVYRTTNSAMTASAMRL